MKKHRRGRALLFFVQKYIKRTHFLFIGCIIFILIASTFTAYLIVNNLIKKTTDGEIPVRKENSSPGDLFLRDIQQNAPHTLQTSAHAYDFVSQYVTNGGNLYAVYDFINAHPELAFLTEASSIYPNVFASVEKRRLPFTYSDNGLYAYLAYLEVLEKYGYNDITITGELAYEYSKFAYYMGMIQKDKVAGRSVTYPDYADAQIIAVRSKARIYAKKAEVQAQSILESTTQYPDISTVQAFSGLVKYAVALRYLAARDTSFASTPSASEIFAFATDYGEKTHLPDMYLPVYYSNAISLILLPDPNLEELRAALLPFFTATPSRIEIPFIHQLLAAKYDPLYSRYSDLNMLSLLNVQILASKVPEFKAWLIQNGWTDKDFKISASLY